MAKKPSAPNIAECPFCFEKFSGDRALTPHYKTCKEVKRIQEQQQLLYALNINTGASMPTGQTRNYSNSTTTRTEFTTTQTTFDINEFNHYDYSDEDSSISFEAKKAYTKEQLVLIDQEEQFQKRMQNSHQMWSNADLGKLELLKIMYKHKCPNSAFEEIFGWAKHYRNLPNTTIFSRLSKKPKRDIFLKNVEHRRGMEKMVPIIKYIELIESKKKTRSTLKIPTFDFKQQVLSLLRDEDLMNPTNLVIEEPGVELKRPRNHISEIQDSKWYEKAVKYYNNKLGKDKNRIVCGVILTVDKTHTDVKGKLCLEPVQFTLSIFNTETRKKKASAWKCLGFINDLDAYKNMELFTDDTDNNNNENENENENERVESDLEARNDNDGNDAVDTRNVMEHSTTEDSTKKKKPKNTQLKSIIYHKVLAKVLESFKESQNTGIVWDLKYKSGVTHRINFVFPLCFCVVDMKGAKQLCGMFDTSNVQRPCVSCYSKLDELHFTHTHCAPVVAKNMIDMIMKSRNNEDLKIVSQHSNKDNVFFNIDTGGWKYGIWGLCPSEVLHQFYEGVILYALEEFMERVLTSKYCRNLERGVGFLINCIKNQSARDTYPTGNFSLGITKIRTMKGVEKFASVFYLALFLNTDLSLTEYFDGDKEMKDNMKQKLRMWRDLFTTCCYYHDWLTSKSFNRASLDGKHMKIVKFHKLFETLIHRKGKGIKGIPKFHEFLHIVRNIAWHGPPTGYSTLPTESNHKPVKSVSKNTQQQIDTFSCQTAQRLHEMSIITSTHEFIQRFSKESYLQKDKKRKRIVQNDTKNAVVDLTRNENNTTAELNILSISSQTQRRYGSFFARYHCATKKVEFVGSEHPNAVNIANTDVEISKISHYIKNVIFPKIVQQEGEEFIHLPCFTTLVREGISFRGLSRDAPNFPGWAMFQWRLSNDSTTEVPAKILVFLDFSNVNFKLDHVRDYVKNELHVIIHSLSTTPTDTYGGFTMSPICKSTLLESTNLLYHCVSINTIYDSTCVIPNLGNRDPFNVLYVYPRFHNTENSYIDRSSENQIEPATSDVEPNQFNNKESTEDESEDKDDDEEEVVEDKDEDEVEDDENCGGWLHKF